MTFPVENFPVSPEPDRPAAVLPAVVRKAVRLMYCGALLEVIRAVTLIVWAGGITDDSTIRDAFQERIDDGDVTMSLQEMLDAARTSIIVGAVVLGVIVTALWLWMAAKNKAGRAWARITATVLGILGIVFSLIGLSGQAGIGQLILGVFEIVLAAVILVLLYRPESNAYFARNGR